MLPKNTCKTYFFIKYPTKAVKISFYIKKNWPSGQLLAAYNIMAHFPANHSDAKCPVITLS